MIWIKLEKADMSERILQLPLEMMSQISVEVTIGFGLRKSSGKIKATNIYRSNKDVNYGNILILKIDKILADRLLINEKLLYRLYYDSQNSTINIGPVIGLLLGDQHYYYHNRFMKEYTESLEIYREIGGLIFAFRAASIDWEGQCVYGLYFNDDIKEWDYGKFPLPSVVFRRGFNTRKSDIDKLKVVTEDRVFNSCRFDKWIMYEILKNSSQMKKYLPETQKIQSTNTVYDFMNRYTNVILKPALLSRGRGILIINKLDNGYVNIFDYTNVKNINFSKISIIELEKRLKDMEFYKKNYIIQPQINLAKINGAPFDIRIVMQKTESNTWQCSGIECRLAGDRDVITNISRGGQAIAISQAVALAFGPKISVLKIKNKAISIAKEFCKCMDGTGELFAEFGLDFALDNKKNIWFIEANVRPTFKGFKIMDYKNYKHICYTPIRYAAFLAGFSKGLGKKEDINEY